MSQSAYKLLSPVSSSKKSKSDAISTHYSVLEDGETSRKAEQTGRSQNAKKKYIAVAFAFILLATVVVVATVLTTGSDYLETSRRAASSRKFTFNEIFGGGAFFAKRFSVHWVSDTEYLHKAWDGAIRVHNLETKRDTEVVSGDAVNNICESEDYTLSADRNWVLFVCNKTPLYRHSFFADYHVYDIKEKKSKQISPPGSGTDQIRYCGWGPKGNALVFVYKNDIYYKDTVKHSAVYRITTDGVDKKKFNGVPDWVYEEEILASAYALKVSPDGKYLAYGSFDASNVSFYKFPIYGSPSNAYTTIQKIAYPKAGYPNPTVTLYAVNLEEVRSTNGHKVTSVKLKVPATFKNGDHYYCVLQWTSDSKPFVSWMNRRQDHTKSLVYHPETGISREVEEHKVVKGWVDDDYVKPFFSGDGTYYITMLPEKVDGLTYRHIAKIRLDTQGKEDPIFLTSGKWDVSDLSCYDPKLERVYFRAGKHGPEKRHLYYVNVKDPMKYVDVSYNLDPNCSFYIVQMSKKCQWSNFMCQGPCVPYTRLKNLKTEEDKMVEKNEVLKKALEGKDRSQTILYNIKSDGYDIAVKEIRPHNFDPNKKYPVLFDVYGGPSTQKVQDNFEIYYAEFLVSNYDIIVVYTDARGASMHGYEFKYAVYRNLGHYEAKDNIKVASELGKRSYIDGKKMCVWGWSFGGFLSSSILATGSGVFKCGIAVAPVTDWRYYDTVYTERYMGLPTNADNLDGYKSTSIIPFVKNFSKSNFLLVHGTADDNVHFQNSAHLAYALAENSIQFRTQFYTDKAHGIEGQTNHLYRLLTNFLVRHLHLHERAESARIVGGGFRLQHVNRFYDVQK